jgi:hypothetical protein
MDSAPIIVSAVFDDGDHRWFDGLRRAHFPPDRNQLPAHLTLFHHLPPSLEGELRGRLAELARAAPPQAEAAGLLNLGRGVAIRIVSPELDAMRGALADAFHGMLTPQDAGGWRPHVTIQNKVEPATARALLAGLEAGFRPRAIGITGLAAYHYRGGPWELIARYPFRGRR